MLTDREMASWAEDIVDDCADTAEVARLIRTLDEAIDEWGLSFALRDHFVALCAELEREEELEMNREEIRR